MPYSLDFSSLGFDFARKRLLEEDLIPSQLPLREGAGPRLAALDKAGMKTLKALSAALAKSEDLAALAERSGIPADWLKLLGRALRGWRPDPAKLADYPLADPGVVEALDEDGIDDSRELWDAAHPRKSRAALAKRLGVAPDLLMELVRLSDLSRIQWVSPLFARLLHDAGFPSVAKVAASKAAAVYEAVASLNEEKELYKGKIGVKDMGRLVFLANLLPFELEE